MIKKLLFFLTSLLVCISLVYLVCYLIPAPKMNKSNEIAIYDKNDELITTFRYDVEDKYLKIDEINEDFLICFLVSSLVSKYLGDTWTTNLISGNNRQIPKACLINKSLISNILEDCSANSKYWGW